MGFVALCLTLLIGILIASFLTNMVRGIIVTFSLLGIVYYFGLASKEDKMSLDSYAMSISVMKGDYLHDLMSQVKGSYNEALEDSSVILSEDEQAKMDKIKEMSQKTGDEE